MSYTEQDNESCVINVENREKLSVILKSLFCKLNIDISSNWKHICFSNNYIMLIAFCDEDKNCPEEEPQCRDDGICVGE